MLDTLNPCIALRACAELHGGSVNRVDTSDLLLLVVSGAIASTAGSCPYYNEGNCNATDDQLRWKECNDVFQNGIRTAEEHIRINVPSHGQTTAEGTLDRFGSRMRGFIDDNKI